MNAVDTTELTAAPTLAIPADVAARLPKSGRARILLQTDDDHSPADLDAAYAQGYARLPEDVSLPAAMLPHIDAGDWE